MAVTDHPIPEPGSSPANSPADESTRALPPGGIAAGTIGPYRLLQMLGEGGMGEVWLAEQSAPIRRHVALKVIKAGMDTKQVVARFEAERQALALMDHPAIAHVYDAGETPRGLPYFAMEYIKGEPITAYCDRHRLTPRERLELFIPVCDGVQHAHQKGIIHRDLKPSNILVTVQVGKPVPKIIDFGVAKATAQRLTERTIYTALGMLIGTPEYMSPEQAEMTELDIDTRTDVYALGIILYQLLAGALPFDPVELRKAGFDEIRRRIREVEPPRPSTRVSTMGEAATESAKNRRTEPRKLVSQLKGDLDWITMKTLEKDRTRRYGSPSDLAADIGRHLRHEPVLAGPPSTIYRARKFVRRHRFGVAVAAVGVIALAGVSASTTIQARRIARERNRAERVSEFLTDLFKVSSPSEARGNAITAREILDKGVEKIHKQLADEPEVQARLMQTMGMVYADLGLYNKAEPLVQRSLETRRRLLGESHPETLASMSNLAYVYREQGRYPEVEKLCIDVVERRRRGQGEDHPDTLRALNGLAVIYEREGHNKEANALYRQVLERMRRVLGEEHPDTLSIMGNLADVYLAQHRYQEAEKVNQGVLEVQRRVLGETHPSTLTTMSRLAICYFQAGQYGEAEKLNRHVLDIQRRTLGEEHPQALTSMNNLAFVYMREGKYADAEKLLSDTLAICRRVFGEDNSENFPVMSNLAQAYSKLGRHKEAEKLYSVTLEKERRVLGERHPLTSLTTYKLGCALTLRGDRRRAMDMLREAVRLGFDDSDRMAIEQDLKSFHGDPAFEALVAGARGNASKKP